MNIARESTVCINVLLCFAGMHIGILTATLEHHKGPSEILVHTSECVNPRNQTHAMEAE